MKFTQPEINYINEYAENYSSPDSIRVYEGYSGRCMYGDTTDGLVVSDFMEIAKLVRQICEDRDFLESDNENYDGDIDVDDFLDKITSLNRRDNLGYDTILY